MNFLRAGFAHHPDNLFRGRAAHNRIINQDDALAFDQVAYRIQFDAHAETANRLLRLDKGAADVVIAHQAKAKRQAAFRRVTNCRRHA